MKATEKNIRLCALAMAELVMGLAPDQKPNPQEWPDQHYITRRWDGDRPGWCTVLLRKVVDGRYVEMLACDLSPAPKSRQ